MPDTWALEADRTAIHHPLLSTLVLIAGHYGRRTSINALTSGLPYQKGDIAPSLFERSALRADLNARLAERLVESLAIAPNLPCILVLKEKQACILWDVKHPEKEDDASEEDSGIHPETTFTVQFPETEEERQDHTQGLVL